VSKGENMFRAFIVSLVMLGMVGCASKASVPTVQDQLDTFKLDVASQHEAMVTKNAEQDAAIEQINAKLDGMFRKGR
jgi:F0F1-type ATP synthase membrane subunit b/b'